MVDRFVTFSSGEDEAASTSPPLRLELLGAPYNAGETGLMVAKGNGELASALQKSLQASVDDGYYAEVLKEFNSSAVEISKIEVR